MKKVIFEKLLIANPMQHKAFEMSFIEGINIVTSNENTVGKSSVLKSLYYTLGANVRFASEWVKNSNLYLLDIRVDDLKYRVLRLTDLYLVLSNGQVQVAARRVGTELAPFFAEIFDFGIYLPDKKQEDKSVLANPVLTFMPYYIDQDHGWNDLYMSFDNLLQYEKKDRIKSLYFHLGVFTKRQVELTAQKERIEKEIREAQEKLEQLNASLRLINEETDYISLLVDSDFEKEKSVDIKDIEEVVGKLKDSRARMQKFESELLQLTKQKQIIGNIKKPEKLESIMPFECPRCGYTLDEEIQAIVFDKYHTESLQFAIEQIDYLIKDCNERLKKERESHILLQKELTALEKTKNQEAELFDLFVKIKGLKAVRVKITEEMSKIMVLIADNNVQLKDLRKRLRIMRTTEDINESYAESLKQRLVAMGSWNEAFTDKLKLLDKISAQGAEQSKVILSQNLALFDVMIKDDTAQTVFPFVIDSPRQKETDVNNSQMMIGQILAMQLPQIILSTCDFSDYYSGDTSSFNIKILTEKRALLNEVMFANNERLIDEYIGMFQTLLGFAPH